MRKVCTFLLILALTTTAALAAKSASFWIDRLGDPDLGRDAREQAEGALRAISTGLPEDPETRAATLALAEYWLTRTGREQEAIEVLTTAVNVYPEDPGTAERLSSLAELQLARRDFFGSHTTLRALLEDHPQAVTPALRARAARNAARAGDLAAAMEWSDGPEALPARLIAAEALDRYDVALRAAETLSEEQPEALRVDGGALLAAARVFEGVGLVEKAVPLYDAFVNVHPEHPERPAAMLTLARLQVKLGRVDRAVRMLEWLVEEHSETDEALTARIEKLEIRDAETSPTLLDDYVSAMRSAAELATARALCDQMTDRFLAAGMVGRVIDTLVSLSNEKGTAAAPGAARFCLGDALAPIVLLLERRGDDVALLAFASDVDRLGLPFPSASRAVIEETRARYGLPRFAEGPLEEVIRRAAASLRERDWQRVVDDLEPRLYIDRVPHPASAVEARRILGEALWRLERDDEAVNILEQALELAKDETPSRKTRVLYADVLFTGGRIEEACREYRQAAESAPSPWVSDQLARCAEEP